MAQTRPEDYLGEEVLDNMTDEQWEKLNDYLDELENQVIQDEEIWIGQEIKMKWKNLQSK